MANDAVNYEIAIRKLFPRGKAFKFTEGKSLTSVVKAISIPFFKVDKRAKQLVDEMNPLYTLELLPEWERVLGLPSKCTPTENVTVQERRFQVISKLSIQGGQSKEFYINLVKLMGFNIDIKEHKRFTCVSKCNDAITNTDPWQFTWDVIVKEAVVYKFNAKSACNESLRVFRNETVQCLINQMKPAHTFVRFIFLGE